MSLAVRPDEITDQMNQALDKIGNVQDPFLPSTSRRRLEETEW
jgi:hypothetical protein